jgi:hypothetical protein
MVRHSASFRTSAKSREATERQLDEALSEDVCDDGVDPEDLMRYSATSQTTALFCALVVAGMSLSLMACFLALQAREPADCAAAVRSRAALHAKGSAAFRAAQRVKIAPLLEPLAPSFAPHSLSLYPQP